jgi:von Willebrand factor type A domain
MSARAAAVVLALALASAAAAQEAQLDFGRRPLLIECGGGSPCFRFTVNAIDQQGQAASLDEKAAFTVTANGREVPIILPSPVSVGGPGSRQRSVTLVLFDTSGSMNWSISGSSRLPSGEVSRFDLARQRLAGLFANIQEGVDAIAIAPFNSRRVVERIRSAPFLKTRAELQRRIAGLPQPEGNTALYSAVYEGLRTLQPRVAADVRTTLIVLTDGKNDVAHQGDDRGLLEGADGLATAQALAGNVGIPIYTIGYGGGDSFDPAALEAIKFPRESRNYFDARDESRLAQIFQQIANRGSTGVRLFAGPVAESREQLPGRIDFRVTTGALAGEISWNGNALMTPPFEDSTMRAERDAWLKSNQPARLVPPYLWRLVVLVVYSGLIAALWFGLPRLLWPDRYIPKPALRAAAATPPRPRASPDPPPAGATAAERSPQRGGERGREAPPSGRTRESPAPPPPARPKESWGHRDPGDATVFIPPSKKPGGRT